MFLIDSGQWNAITPGPQHVTESINMGFRVSGVSGVKNIPTYTELHKNIKKWDHLTDIK